MFTSSWSDKDWQGSFNGPYIYTFLKIFNPFSFLKFFFSFCILTKTIKERSILQNLPVVPDWLSEQDLCYTSAKTPNRIKANKTNQSDQIESKLINRIKANKSKTSHHNCSKQYDLYKTKNIYGG